MHGILFHVNKRKLILTHFRVTLKGENNKRCLSSIIFFSLSFFFPISFLLFPLSFFLFVKDTPNSTSTWKRISFHKRHKLCQFIQYILHQTNKDGFFLDINPSLIWYWAFWIPLITCFLIVVWLYYMIKDHGRPRMSKEMGPKLKFLVQKHSHLLSIYDLNMINQKSCISLTECQKRHRRRMVVLCIWLET